MPIVLAKCTECGGTIKVDSEKKLGVCENCGEPFVVEDAINNFTNYYTTNYITNNNTTHNYGEGSVVNIYEKQNKDFDIEGGVLKAYHGEALDVVIPEGVISIGERCFYKMNITSVSFPDSIEKIEQYAFYDCNRIERVSFPQNLKTIAYCGFARSRQIKELEVYNTTVLESSAFSSTKVDSFVIKAKKGSTEVKSVCFYPTGAEINILKIEEGITSLCGSNSGELEM